MKQKEEYLQVQCPVCGYKMPIFYTNDAASKGVMVSCKGRHCSCVFELKIEKGKQIK